MSIFKKKKTAAEEAEIIQQEILSEEKPNQKEQIKFKVESVRNYFPKGYSVEQMQKVMQKLLEEYQIKWKRRMQEKEMVR